MPGASVRGRAAAAALALAASGALGCAAIGRTPALAPEALRAQVAPRLTSIEPADLDVPFEVSDEDVARARMLVSRSRTRSEKTRQLLDVLFDPSGLGLRYAVAGTKTARETLASGEGNCLALASVFVGLARGLGLRAYYLDASACVTETHADESVIVDMGHVTAAVETEEGALAMDFGWQLGRCRGFRRIGDLEAVAHHYNNLGYEVIRGTSIGREPPDWTRAAHLFAIATEVKQDFVRAWNNLGIALGRLGRPEEAVRAYDEAIARAPDFAAAHLNLGVLRLRAGALDEAIASFREAVRLEPENPCAHYDLALALLARGETRVAERAAGRALELQDDFPGARELAARIRAADSHAGPKGAESASTEPPVAGWQGKEIVR